MKSISVNGILAVVLTFFLGFIGTFISRFFLAKQQIKDVLIYTLIHALAILLVYYVPTFGWIVYLLVTLYFIYTNYMLCK